ncbi:hypothetical protein AHMF7605_21720 [Adhaeribacter arboris]|uniref:Uncharacterized protein n=1 Tax=Adhaeribacter arboris TaxID=2072846 RepID=A0A2T2YK94_9BACT|nr:hypothetical protein AHMF7605_21720 [Adhaeribacter arboris]
MKPWNTFESLSQLEKLEYIHNRGKFLACRDTFFCSIFLFYVPNFFVEINISKNKAKCEYIEAFNATLRLEPYLEKIKLRLDW